VWLQRSGERWSGFGGGGCELHRGGEARDFCMLGLAASWQATTRLQLGAEIHHETPQERGARASSDRTQWYAACLLTL
jgi:hypothetical protein